MPAEENLPRFTVSIDDELVRSSIIYMEKCGHKNRSEAVRDFVRASRIEGNRESDASRQCIAELVYADEPETRQLGKRLTAERHRCAGLSLTRSNLAIDADACLDVSFLRGKRSLIEKFSRQITAERGVRYGQLVIIPS